MNSVNDYDFNSRRVGGLEAQTLSPCDLNDCEQHYNPERATTRVRARPLLGAPWPPRHWTRYSCPMIPQCEEATRRSHT